MCTKLYQNRLGFVEDMTKTFWYVFWFTMQMLQNGKITTKPATYISKTLQTQQF